MSPVKIDDIFERIISDNPNPMGAARAKRAIKIICIFFLNLLSRKIAASERETGI